MQQQNDQALVWMSAALYSKLIVFLWISVNFLKNKDWDLEKADADGHGEGCSGEYSVLGNEVTSGSLILFTK